MKAELVIPTAVCGALLLGSTAFAATSLTVLNHSFESPAAPGSVNSVGQVNGAATSWTGFGVALQFFPEHPEATYYNPQDVLSIPGQGDAVGGTQGGLATVGGSGLYQTLDESYVAGATYTFTLWVGGSYESPGGTQTIGFTTAATNLDGAMLASNSVAFPNGGNNWVQNSVTYVATTADDGQAIRIILGTNSANGSQTFDLAEVSVVPEPSGLMLLGIAGLGFLSVRKRS